MTTIAQVRTNLATAAAVAAYGGVSLSCSPYITDPVTAPCARVYRKPADPRMVLSQAKSVHTFGLVLYAGRMSDRASEILLDAYSELSGASSILAAVQNGANWSVTVDYASVTKIGAPMQTSIGKPNVDAVEYLTVEFDIEVAW